MVGMVRGSQLPEDQAWTRSLMQQSWPPSQRGPVPLALKSRGQDLSPASTSTLQDAVSSVPGLHQVALMDPRAWRVTEVPGPGLPGPSQEKPASGLWPEMWDAG